MARAKHISIVSQRSEISKPCELPGHIRLILGKKSVQRPERPVVTLSNQLLGEILSGVQPTPASGDTSLPLLWRFQVVPLPIYPNWARVAGGLETRVDDWRRSSCPSDPSPANGRRCAIIGPPSAAPKIPMEAPRCPSETATGSL